MNFASILAHLPLLGPVSQFAASALVTSIWQSALIAVALSCALRLAPRSSASLRFSLWMIALVAVVCLPFVPVLASLFGENSAVANAASAAPASHRLLLIDARWSLAVVGLWLAASLYRAIDLGVDAIRVRKLWMTSNPVKALLPVQAGSLRDVEICTSAHLDRPSVLGFFSPRILIPDWLYSRLTPSELEQVLLHESEHLRRRDDWTNLIQKLSLVLFPLNPALVWIDRRLGLEREMACDEGVIQRTHAPRAYATCLTNLAERGLQHRSEALSLGAWHHRPELARRIQSLLHGKGQLNPAAAATLMITIGGALISGSYELSRVPQLVAFAPLVHNAVSSRDASKIPATEHAGIVNASYTEGPGSRSASNARALELKATTVVPRMTPLHTQMEHSRLRNLRVVTKPLSSESEAIQERVASQVVPANGEAIETAAASGAEQHWIVLTTWEQTVNRPAQSEIVTDEPGAQDSYTEGQATSNTKGSTKASDPGQTYYQTTITQLVLRVIPAQSIVPATEKPNSIRSGWFFFQL